MWALAAALFAPAHAGDLVVTTITPVVVRIDGTAIDYVPGTMVAQVAGLQGVHKVEIHSVTGQALAQMNVSIPAQGGTALTWDGASLVVASAGMNGATATVSVGVPAAAPAAAPAPAPEGPEAMDAGAFAKLIAAIDNASFSDDKLAVVRTAATKNWFSIDQVGQIVDHLNFGNHTVNAVGAVAARVVDPENAFQLSSHFDFSGDADKALAMFR